MGIVEKANAILVLKYGGSLESESSSGEDKFFSAHIKVIQELVSKGNKVILVHGGGKSIDKRLGSLGLEGRFEGGYRVTGLEEMVEIEMLLSGHIRNRLVHRMNQAGLVAVGLSGKDGGMIHAVAKTFSFDGKPMTYGCVGEVVRIETKVLETLMNQGIVPVISPIGMDFECNTYNINADTVAGKIAEALKADRLILMTDVEGLYETYGQSTGIIHEIGDVDLKDMIVKGQLEGGMIPKALTAVEAVCGGVGSVHMIDGKNFEALQSIACGGAGSGTRIFKQQPLGQERWESLTSCVMPTYKRKAVCLQKGQGAYVWDILGKRYLDFVSGVAVNIFGHCDPEIVGCIKEQADQLLHVSNLYWNPQQLRLAEALIKASNGVFEAAFFCNSGTEAIEGAIKIARKYGHHLGKRKIVFLEGSFHGRSTGALTVTSEPKYRRPFLKEDEETIKLEPNCLEALRKLDFSEVAAVIVEPIQGEGGLAVVEDVFLKELKALSESKDFLLIYDEVQCGIGRTGEFYASQQIGISPDVTCLAKGLGGGIPIGAIVVNARANILEVGEHGSTFGGNPLVCAVANNVVERAQSKVVLDYVKEASLYMCKKLQIIKTSHSEIVDEIRGRGLLLGIKIKSPFTSEEVVEEAFAEGLLLVGAGQNVVRLLPPLNVSFKEIDEFLIRMDCVLKKIAKSK